MMVRNTTSVIRQLKRLCQILVGDAVTDRHEFPDPYDSGVPNYLYNLDPARLPV